MEQVKLYDTTLRDGMGGSGMSLSVGEKLKVVRALDELGIHFVAAGHYATERLGVQALATRIAETFDVDSRFIELTNPV